jgi:predicted DNA-binding transcriptional regulator AlpA
MEFSAMSLEQIQVGGGASEASPRIYEPAAYSVDAFCRAHSLSRSKFYEMLRSGEGPRVMKCGVKTLVSVEAARDWRLARERAAAERK